MLNGRDYPQFQTIRSSDNRLTIFSSSFFLSLSLSFILSFVRPFDVFPFTHKNAHRWNRNINYSCGWIDRTNFKNRKLVRRALLSLSQSTTSNSMSETEKWEMRKAIHENKKKKIRIQLLAVIKAKNQTLFIDFNPRRCVDEGRRNVCLNAQQISMQSAFLSASSPIFSF